MSDHDDLLRFLACGSVDDGKSTLIGHLLHLTGNLPDDQLCTLTDESARTGTAGGLLDYSLLMDGLMAEREQGITIDVAFRYFSTPRRKFIVADTPGHESFTRNMATGASQCTAALILVDAGQGVQPQTRRHAMICALMGIRNLLFVVNKMDRLDWKEANFRKVEAQCREIAMMLQGLGLVLAGHAVVPVSALHGDNLVSLSSRMPWYGGMTILEWLNDVPPQGMTEYTAFRLPVQHVLKAGRSSDDWQCGTDRIKEENGGVYRAYAGTITSGAITSGDRVVVLPAGVTTTVETIFAGDHPVDRAEAGMAVAVTVAGDHDIGRGDCFALECGRPEMANIFKVQLVWLHESALFAGRHYLFRGVCGTAVAQVVRLRDRLDLESGRQLSCDRFTLNDIGEIEISLSRLMPFDPYHLSRETGGFILIDRLTNATVACGMIIHPMRRAENIHWHQEAVSRQQRAGVKGQKPCVIWLTGLSGSGKSTISNHLERRLLDMGHHTMLLDGDNIRHGLNKDLGFTEAGRIENIRRIGEVSKLMADAGLIVITAFISPFRAEREMVRQLLPAGEFMEVHVSTSLEECEQRDPKGLYKKARRGDIPNFTGINSPYEAPEHPELVLDTVSLTVDECVQNILNRLQLDWGLY